MYLYGSSAYIDGDLRINYILATIYCTVWRHNSYLGRENQLQRNLPARLQGTIRQGHSLANTVSKFHLNVLKLSEPVGFFPLCYIIGHHVSWTSLTILLVTKATMRWQTLQSTTRRHCSFTGSGPSMMTWSVGSLVESRVCVVIFLSPSLPPPSLSFSLSFSPSLPSSLSLCLSLSPLPLSLFLTDAHRVQCPSFDCCD